MLVRLQRPARADLDIAKSDDRAYFHPVEADAAMEPGRRRHLLAQDIDPPPYPRAGEAQTKILPVRVRSGAQLRVVENDRSADGNREQIDHAIGLEGVESAALAVRLLGAPVQHQPAANGRKLEEQ